MPRRGQMEYTILGRQCYTTEHVHLAKERVMPQKPVAAPYRVRERIGATDAHKFPVEIFSPANQDLA